MGLADYLQPASAVQLTIVETPQHVGHDEGA